MGGYRSRGSSSSFANLSLALRLEENLLLKHGKSFIMHLLALVEIDQVAIFLAVSIRKHEDRMNTPSAP
jgi:hypothetical protein